MPRSHWQELSGFTKPETPVPRVHPAEERSAAQRQHAGDQLTGAGDQLTGAPESPSDLAGFDGDDEESQFGEEHEPPDTPADNAAPVVETVPDAGETEEISLQPPHPIAGRGTTRSGRRIKITEPSRESHVQRGQKLVSWLASSLPAPQPPPTEDEIYEIFAHQEYDVQDRADDPIAFSATSDKDTMYWHQAMQEPDRADFLKAAVAEVKSHVDNKHFVLMERKDLPEDTKVLASVWSMKRKRRILSREIYKWKARLNAHGGQQEHGINFWETYAPVVNWFSIRLFLVISILQGWHTRQIDFVLAFPQADVECDMYMEVPPGFDVKGAKKKYCLKLKKNIYGTKQAGRVWNKHLHKGLTKLGYVSSKIDPCVYYKGRSVFMLYVDDGIFAGPDKKEIDDLIEGLKGEFKITDEGDLTEYLGVLVEKQADGRTKLSQPHLIKEILDDL
jgi:hypothetical protein